MRVSGFWSLMGAIVLVAIVATVLASGNTSTDVTSIGTALQNIFKTAEAG
jgi:predicted small secreted protein